MRNNKVGQICKNQDGFSAVEALLILVILGIVGFTGYYVWHAKKNTDKSLTSSSSNTPVIKKKTATTDPYAGWQTYASADEKFKIKYPNGWAVANESPDGNLKESIALRGPNNFTLTYSLVKYDSTFTVASAKAEASDAGTPDPTNSNAYNVIDSFSPTGFSQALYVVSTSSDVGEPGGPVNNIELSGYKNYQTQPLGYPGYYIAKNNSGYMVQWFGGYSKPAPSSGPVGMSTATFLASPEVKTATLIFKSISY